MESVRPKGEESNDPVIGQKSRGNYQTVKGCGDGSTGSIDYVGYHRQEIDFGRYMEIWTTQIFIDFLGLSMTFYHLRRTYAGGDLQRIPNVAFVTDQAHWSMFCLHVQHTWRKEGTHGDMNLSSES